MKRILFISIVLLLISLPADAQCAMCRAVLESEGDTGMAQGVNNGIVYLMIFPYLLVGGVIFAIYRTFKKSKQKKEMTE